MRGKWNTYLSDELVFWEQIISGSFPNRDWVSDFHKQAHGIDVAPSHTRPFLTKGCRVLDVGSGPATVLGGVLAGDKLDITAIDPLADEYLALFSKYSVNPLVKPIKGEAERLEDFVTGKFRFVYSRNALDHAYDPLVAIQSMINVCKDGGVVMFDNIINEGYNENYHGLHQWNFMPASGDLVIWKRDGEACLAGTELSGYSKLTVKSNNGWVSVKIAI